jgi:hypothetical protein
MIELEPPTTSPHPLEQSFMIGVETTEDPQQSTGDGLQGAGGHAGAHCTTQGSGTTLQHAVR